MSYVIIKLSGFVIEDEKEFNSIPSIIKSLISAGKKPVLVHGGGTQIDVKCKEHNIEIIKKEGRRVTSKEVLDLMLQHVHGNLNRHVVGLLMANDIQSFGITAADFNYLSFKKRPPLQIGDEMVDFGFVGDIHGFHKANFDAMSENGIPVISCFGFDPHYGWLNTNADTITKEIAIGAEASSVLLFSNVEQVWDDVGNALSKIDITQIKSGKEDGWIKEGMIVKLDQASELADKGISVWLGKASNYNKGIGTEVV